MSGSTALFPDVLTEQSPEELQVRQGVHAQHEDLQLRHQDAARLRCVALRAHAVLQGRRHVSAQDWQQSDHDIRMLLRSAA